MFTTNHSLGQSSKLIKQKQEGTDQKVWQQTSIKESNNIISSSVYYYYSIAIE